MNIYPTIEALLHYANIHLLFDELDYVYARNRIMELLSLSDYEEYEIDDDEIEAMQTPDQIIDALVSYAVAQKVIAEDGRADLSRKLIACILKRPSEIADIFQDLPAPKAFDWLFDYNYKCGNIVQNKKWEAKATKGKIEVAFTGCDCKGCCEKTVYPKCKACRDNEGFGKNLNMRMVPVELYGDRMFFYCKSRPLVQSEGVIVSEYHTPLKADAVMLNKMFDFASMLPGWFIAAREGEHEKYSVGSKPAPLSKAPDKTRFKSAAYPYINISVVDWYFGAVRLSCTNREKLIEYSDILIKKWNEKEGREVAAVVRKIDSNYCVELMLLNKGFAPAPQYANLTKLCGVLPLLGVFGIGKAKEEQLKTIERFVTKEEKFSPAKLEGDMGENADMINRLLTTVGSSKPSQLEASLDVKDEVNKTLENALISINTPIDELYGNF